MKIGIFIGGAVFLHQYEVKKGKSYFLKILSEGWGGNIIFSLESFWSLDSWEWSVTFCTNLHKYDW